METTLTGSKEQSLAAVIDEVLGGNAEAFEVVVRQFHGPLHAFMLCRAPRPALADDLTQQTLVIAYERLGRYDIRSC